MEFVLEILFEIIIEGCLEVWSEKKVPMPLRILGALLFLVFYLGISGVLIYIGYEAMMSGEPVVAFLFYAVGFGLLIGVLYMIRKKFKEKSKQQEEETNGTEISKGKTTE